MGQDVCWLEQVARRTNFQGAWLDLAQQKPDEAVADAYGWPHDLTDEQILERLLALHLARVTNAEIPFAQSSRYPKARESERGALAPS